MPTLVHGRAPTHQRQVAPSNIGWLLPSLQPLSAQGPIPNHHVDFGRGRQPITWDPRW